jgi:hypothetical protein
MIFTRSILALGVLFSVAMASADSLESLYKSFERMTISPVELNGKAIDARSASALCGSLDYTLVVSTKERDCARDEEILSHLGLEQLNTSYNYQMYTRGGSATELKETQRCQFTGAKKVLDSVVCARPKR